MFVRSKLRKNFLSQGRATSDLCFCNNLVGHVRRFPAFGGGKGFPGHPLEKGCGREVCKGRPTATGHRGEGE